MITDKQGREWVLQKLYDDGWRYIVGSLDDYVYITQREPTIVNGFFRSIGLCEIYKHIELKSVLPSLECGEIMNIAEELGIVDWSKVAVDTPILVSFDGCNWVKNILLKYKTIQSMLLIMALHRGVLVMWNIVLLRGYTQN